MASKINEKERLPSRKIYNNLQMGVYTGTTEVNILLEEIENYTVMEIEELEGYHLKRCNHEFRKNRLRSVNSRISY
ncbi:hypothetical protein [Oceanobacillus jordanicus]|uniref:Fur-regulated basic protein FbpA n=1 Tax=Oceanobacillus jordanicus TaxID=2867266 RepID=A0AAW5AXH2_9BACI|nr:hypothetical protein [Oceanobacillus jordanicus]MCG3417556.1 hypothetical protein [Oceanobacillus jordanicus]